MIGYSELAIMFYEGKHRLFHGKKDTGITLSYDFDGNGNYLGKKDQYWIVFNDGTKSQDFYNFTHASDNAKKYYLEYMNNRTENDQGIGS